MAEAKLYDGVALVAYVDGKPVDANGNEVKGAPPEPESTEPSQMQAMASLNTEERSAAILANALATALGERSVAVPRGGK